MFPILELDRMRQAFRLAGALAGLLGAVTLIVAAVLGYPAFGLAACAGLALGAGNAWLMMRSAGRVAESGRRRSAAGVIGRLAIVTLIALGIVWLMGAPGLGALAGLVAFQFLMLFATGRAMMAGLRDEGSS